MSARILSSFVALICLLPIPIFAQDQSATLMETLRRVYEQSPALKAAQAELRATDEIYAQALSGWRPNVVADATIYKSSLDNSNFNGADGATTKSGTLSLEQPLYRGGKTTAEVKRAKNLVNAAQARLHLNEQTLMLQTVAVYMDVYRDQSLLTLSLNNENRLNQELTAAKERFDAGDITLTDVRQAEARLARAVADRVAASGSLETSLASFEKIAGFTPSGNLAFPQWKFVFPGTIDDLMAEAEQYNPELRAAREQHEAAVQDIKRANADLLPQVSAFASYNQEYDPQPGLIDDARNATIGIRARIALFQGGLLRSKIRETKNMAIKRQYDIADTQRSIKEKLMRNWKNYQAAQAEAQSRITQIEATKLASEGVREEARMGERTILDILDADQELLSAQASMIRARSNEMVSSFALAASLGRLNPENIGMPDIAYNPKPHAEATGKKIFSTDPD